MQNKVFKSLSKAKVGDLFVEMSKLQMCPTTVLGVADSSHLHLEAVDLSVEVHSMIFKVAITDNFGLDFQTQSRRGMVGS